MVKTWRKSLLIAAVLSAVATSVAFAAEPPLSSVRECADAILMEDGRRLPPSSRTRMENKHPGGRDVAHRQHNR